MQIPDTSMIGRAGRNFSQGHDLMRISAQWFRETPGLPDLHYRSKQANMGGTDPRIIFDRVKENP